MKRGLSFFSWNFNVEKKGKKNPGQVKVTNYYYLFEALFVLVRVRPSKYLLVDTSERNSNHKMKCLNVEG